MRREHRQSERHKVRFKLVYDDGHSFNAGHVMNVSETGLFLETALPLPVGTVVRLMPLDSDSEAIFEAYARVMRTVQYDPTSIEPAGMGLMFIDLTEDDRRKVMEMIRTLMDKAAKLEGELDPFLGVIIPNPPGRPASTLKLGGSDSGGQKNG